MAGVRLIARRAQINDPLCQLIARKLRRKWSPQQIAGWLKRIYPNEERHRASHETIYRSLFAQTHGILKKELQECLGSPRAIRRSRHATQKGLKLRKTKDAIPISERPREVEDRAVPGHWERDLIVGSNNSYIATLVKRHSRFVMRAKGRKQGHAKRHRSPDQAGVQAAQRTVQIADLGPWI